MLVKRQGTFIAPGPVVTVHPTAGDSQIPEIGGSSAGFIALVVILAAIFLICCIAVFFLLRNHSPTPYERRLREVEARQRGSSLYETPLGPPGMRARFARWFGSKKGAGWVRAGDGDEWEVSEERFAVGPRQDLRERKATVFAAPYVAHDMSTDSVELSAAPQVFRDERFRPPVPPVTIPEPTYADPFTSSPTAMERTEAESKAAPGDDGRFSVKSSSSGDSDSVRSMRKFGGGTKFKESLE